MHNSIKGEVSGSSVQAETIHSISITTPEQQAAKQEATWAPIPIGEADPRALGVHPARRGNDGSPLPPYVERDIDVTLRDLLTQSKTSGGAVLVEGDSASGKTRSALSAIEMTFPDGLLFSPRPGEDMHTLIAHLPEASNQGTVVIWLDDLHRFLGLGERGLNDHIMEKFRQNKVVTVATLRSEFGDIYRSFNVEQAQEEGLQWDPSRGERDEMSLLLRRFSWIELERNWSTEEVNRACATGDNRLKEAASYHKMHGIAEYLAAGPELLRKWTQARRSTHRGGHPRGHSVVAAAIDLARTGLLTAVTRVMLEESHQHYLSGAAGLRPESFDEALAWAQKPGLGASGLLLPTNEDEECWRAFDYLIEAATSPVPKPIWRMAINHAANKDELMAIAINAHYADQHDIAMEICRPLAEEGEPRAMNRVGYWARSVGRIDEAEAWYQKAAATGNTNSLVNLGIIMSDRGEDDKAEEFYRKAIDLGNKIALVNLSILLTNKGDTKEAEKILRRSVESGNTQCINSLGVLLHTDGRIKEAEAVYQLGAEVGNGYAIYNLGVIRLNEGRMAEAVEYLKDSLKHLRGDADTKPRRVAEEIIEKWDKKSQK
ncbi:tetratricopeptide repeat protein [Nocardiopsis dassonvillei]|uniref:tetratricopeptide repeat protein n=1 Tax=Nocardiopsis dassonvillei TaxID=2014 RepID=UPI00364478A0